MGTIFELWEKSSIAFSRKNFNITVSTDTVRFHKEIILEKLDGNSMDLELLVSVIQNMEDMILVQDLSHKFVFSNDYTAKLFGYKNSEIMCGISAHEIRCRAADSASQFTEQNQRVIKEKSSINLLDIHKYADNNTHIFLTKKSPVFQNGILTYTLCHCREISQDSFQRLSIAIAQDDNFFHKSQSDDQRTYQLAREQDELTKRELECLFFLLRGKTAAQIANFLFLSKRTVENHIVNIKQKLNCTKKSELIEYGMSQGYLNIIPESLLKKELSIMLDN